MSKFILKKTADGLTHLYFDTPYQEGFTKLAQAQHAEFIKKYACTYVVLTNDNQPTKTLFGIIDDKFFQTTLDINAKITFVDDVICIYERDSVWYTMLLNSNIFEEKQLGKKYKHFLSCPTNIKYKKCYWTYFIKEDNGYLELSHFIEKKHIILGKYTAIKTNNDEKVFGLTDNRLYDIFTPTSTSPLKGEKRKAFESYCDTKGVFLFIPDKEKWAFYPNFYLWGTNSAYKINKYADKKIEYRYVIELCKIKDNQLHLFKVSNNYRFTEKPFGIIIDEMFYNFDRQTKLLDFDNPKPTFKRKLKNFFGID